MVLELILTGGTIVTGILARRRAKQNPVQVVEEVVEEPVIDTSEKNRPETKSTSDPVVKTTPVVEPVKTVEPVAPPPPPPPKKVADPIPPIVPSPIFTPVAPPPPQVITAAPIIPVTIAPPPVLSAPIIPAPVVVSVQPVVSSRPAPTEIIPAPAPVVKVQVSSQTLSVREVQNVVPVSVATEIKKVQASIAQGEPTPPQRTVAIITAPVQTSTGTKVMKVAEVTNTGKILEV